MTFVLQSTSSEFSCLSAHTTTNASQGWIQTASQLHFVPRQHTQRHRSKWLLCSHHFYRRNTGRSWWIDMYSCVRLPLLRLSCHEGLPLELWAKINSTSLGFSHQTILSHWQEEKLRQCLIYLLAFCFTKISLSSPLNQFLGSTIFTKISQTFPSLLPSLS